MTLAASLVTWQDDYALGLEEIDAQHKTLFDIMNRLWAGIVSNAALAEMAQVLQELEHYTVQHFTEEEMFMRGIGYPHFDAHVADAGQDKLNDLGIGYPHFDAHVALHRRFVQKIVDEKNKILHGQRPSLELLHFLRDWLANHILVEDRRYTQQFHAEEHSTSLLGRFFGRFQGKKPARQPAVSYSRSLGTS